MPKVKDPVCGMMCDPETSKWKTDYEGQTYHFCSQSCLEQFEADPEKYVTAERPEQRERQEPPYTTKGGITAPKFGSATSGGGEFERLPEAQKTTTKSRPKKK